jgi:hypothetical protein
VLEHGERDDRVEALRRIGEAEPRGRAVAPRVVDPVAKIDATKADVREPSSDRRAQPADVPGNDVEALVRPFEVR